MMSMYGMYVVSEEEKKRSVEGLNELIREVKNKLATDPDNAAEHLSYWGVFLYTMSRFMEPQEATYIAKDSISKLEGALQINPKAHDTWQLLGTVLYFYVSLNLAKDEAQIYLQKAIEYFQKALNKDPGNETYLRRLESATRKLAAYSKEAVGKVPVNEHSSKSLKTQTQDPGNKRKSESLEAAAQCTGNGHYPEPLKNSIQRTSDYFKKVPGRDLGNEYDLKFSEPSIQESKIFGNGLYGKYVWTILSVATLVGVGLSRLSVKNV